MNRGYKILAGIFFLLPLPAYAQGKSLPPLELQGKYTVAWNGITIGRIRLTIKETDESYQMTVDTKTHGIGSAFSSEKRIAEVNGARSGGRYIPAHYESRPQDSEAGGRRTTLTYDKSGLVKTRERVPDDDPEWRPVVTPKQANGTTDPVTAGLILRSRIAAKPEGTQEIALKTYDGARLAVLHFAPLRPTAKVGIMDSYRDARTFAVTREPVAGYTPKEIKNFNKGDPEIRLYFSADEKVMPLRATIATVLGELSATLTELE